MTRSGIFLIVFFFFGNLYAQKKSDYFSEIAGDSTLSSGKNIYTRDIGDTVKFSIDKGLHRIVFSKGIKINDAFNFQILNSTGQHIEFNDHGAYIDFFNVSRGDICLIISTEHQIEVEVVGKLFWIYQIHIKQDAPDFSLSDIYGNVYTNDNLLGKIVVFNFWGIWCKPCVKEIPQLNKLAKFYSDRDDVIFLAVSSDSEKNLKTFIKKKEIPIQTN